MSALPDPAERPLLGVEEARHAVGDVLGKSAFYAALNSGQIPGLRKIGRRSFVVTAELRTWLALDDGTAPSANGMSTNGTERSDE